MEEQVFRANRHGVHKAPSLLEYKSPTTMEMPEVVSYIIEDPDPNGPFGAKEVGQGPLLPVAPAVVNAVHSAVGVRIDEIPVTPEKILKALASPAKRHGPTKIPEVTWPEPIRVPTPWEGGEGRAREPAP
jgi:CO/xanthine dehydrogenase Mo-binding subunit